MVVRGRSLADLKTQASLPDFVPVDEENDRGRETWMAERLQF